MDPSPTGTDAPPSAEAIGRAFLRAIADGDLDAINRLLDPDAEWWVQGWGTMARDMFVASLGATIRRSAARTMEIVSVTGQGDRVAIEACGNFSFPEGAYRNSYVYMFETSQGRILAGREYLDTQVAARFFA